MSKRNLINELYFQLNGIRAVADSMTNMCVAYKLPPHNEAQIHGIEQSITALTEKAEKLVSEIEKTYLSTVDSEKVSKNATGGEIPSEKMDIMSNLPEQTKTDTLSDLHDDAVRILGLANVACELTDYIGVGGGGLHAVINTMNKDMRVLSDNLEAVA